MSERKRLQGAEAVAATGAELRIRYEACHPEDTLDHLVNRSRFSKQDRLLLRDWLAAYAGNRSHG